MPCHGIVIATCMSIRAVSIIAKSSSISIIIITAAAALPLPLS